MKRTLLTLLAAVLTSAAAMADNVVAIYVTGQASESYKKVIGQKLTSAISQTQEFIAVERTDDINEIMQEEEDYQRSGLVANVSRIGEHLGANFVVVADITYFSEFREYYVTARLIATQTRQVLETAEDRRPINSLDALDILARNLSKSLIISLRLNKDKYGRSTSPRTNPPSQGSTSGGGNSKIRPHNPRDSSMEENADALLQIGKKALHENKHSEAVRWLWKSAEQGNAEAQFLLGRCYHNGIGVERDCYKAANNYRKAANQGFVDAIYFLGKCYDQADGVKEDYNEAIKLFRKAAEKGSKEAQCQLGMYYQWGTAVKKNINEAVKWYRMAAEQGEIQAQCNLGFILYYGGYGDERYPKNTAEGLYWLKKAAKHSTEAWHFMHNIEPENYGEDFELKIKK